ncbi:MAG: ArsA-related P-loop ATPase, partial [Lutibacter sp.]|nr:ArsA-related P-loop ATPase [Lutibacter sp.]
LNVELQKKMVADQLSNVQELNHLLNGIDELVENLTKNKTNGLIMTMGKGGVGKTITASALAIMIARKGFEVHLTTTDPAAHVQDFINQVSDLPKNLTIDRIDPKLETQRYTDKIVLQKGKDMDEQGKKLLLEDLRSPCTQEVAVFHAFSKAIQLAKRKFMLIDTAPIGHTLLLLDTAGNYHREVLKNTGLDPAHIKTPYMALQDSELSKIILVSLPETTPMREAAALQEDLQRADIGTYAWVINQSLSMQKNLKDPLLKSRALTEVDVINKIDETLAKRIYGIPYLSQESLLPALLEYYHSRQILITK